MGVLHGSQIGPGVEDLEGIGHVVKRRLNRGRVSHAGSPETGGTVHRARGRAAWRTLNWSSLVEMSDLALCQMAALTEL